MNGNQESVFSKKLSLAIDEPFNVSLEGESGVGKEYFSRLIHEKRLKTKDFIVFDWECDYLSQHKILDNLIGNHLKEMMDFHSPWRNTYFLRRMDLLPFQIQIRFFEIFERELENGTISKSQLYRLGMISSWEKSQKDGNQQNDFSNILIGELFPVTIKIPPLRERKKDMHSILHNILNSVNQEQEKNIFGFSKEGVEIFLRYSWPNNIDELESEIQRAVALTADYERIIPQTLSRKLMCNQLLSKVP